MCVCMYVCRPTHSNALIIAHICTLVTHKHTRHDWGAGLSNYSKLNKYSNCDDNKNELCACI